MTTQVFNLADWRTERTKAQPELKPLFPVSERPGMDFNEMGHGLKAFAQLMRGGQLTTARAAELLDRLSVNAHAACRAGHDLEFHLSHAHRLLAILDPSLADLEGKELQRAVSAKVKAHRTARYWSKRKGGRPKPRTRRKART